MKKEIKQSEKIIYVASDGKEFDCEWECENYETEIEYARLEHSVDDLRIWANTADWPSMADPIGAEHTYTWFKLESDKDLERLCKGYAHWFRDFQEPELIKPMVHYPDMLCVVDYPHGPDSQNYFTLSKLILQANAFLNQLDTDFTERFFTNLYQNKP